jgi:D-serine dehydratase
MLTINQKMSELRFNEETKLETSSKMLARKEKELDEAMNREHRLNSLLENMRQEMKRADGQNREKVEEVRRVEAGLRQTLQANAKELENKER